MAIYKPDISDLWTRGLSIWRGQWKRGQWKMGQHRTVGFMLKLVLHSLGNGEPWKSLEDDRSYDPI